ncbi:IS66-like element accessory protein TnpA [Escherichia coli]|uniref:IS66-like element accessory protein TnpA n=3 Tax=Escherichia coli TaxID=562 RepID=UPI001FCE4814|nr:transposase [Escherichia coli]
MQKNVTPGRRKGCPNYPPEFKQQLVAASCEPGISISKLALENGINANLLFKWRQQWREGKLLLPSSESPQLLPVTLDAAAEQPESLAEDPETLSISCCQRRMTIAPFVTVCCKRMRTPGSTSCIAMVG